MKQGSLSIVHPSFGSSPSAATTTAHTAAATPDAPAATPTTPTTEATAPTTTADMRGAGPPRSGSALQARAAAIAVPAHLTPVADALEGLSLSVPVGALAVARADLLALLPELSLSCSTRFRTVGALGPHATSLDITPNPFRAAARQLLPATLRATAEGFAPIAAGTCRAVKFLLARRVTVLHALTMFDVVLPLPIRVGG